MRRSGSTAFWRIFRQDKRLLCFDEPFNPMLRQLPKRFLKKTNDEFIEIYGKDKQTFTEKFSPIDYNGEVSSLNSAEIEYLNYLFSLNENVVIDATRLNFKIAELVKHLDKNIFLIHLYRSPQAFVSSHLIPNRPEYKDMKLKYFYSRFKAEFNKRFFWSIKRNFNDWGYETIYNLLNADNNPAYIKLLWLWQLAYRNNENALANHGNSLSLPFEYFTQQPEKIIREIYERNNFEYNRLDYSKIRRPNLGFEPDNKKWTEAFKLLKMEDIVYGK